MRGVSRALYTNAHNVQPRLSATLFLSRNGDWLTSKGWPNVHPYSVGTKRDMMMRLAVLLVVISGWLSPVAAQPQPGPVVVELFTSQGCSSCPPADALLMELSTREDVLPLALHVDYWDYIGWPDKFASPKFTKRQKAYAHHAGRSMIYTPQMIIGGQTDIAGFKPVETMAAIDAHKTLAKQAELSVSRTGDRLEVSMAPHGKGPGAVRVVLVRFTPHARVTIRGGENTGRVMDYVNIVTQWTPLAEWEGTAPARLEAPYPGDDEGAVLLQADGPGPVFAAARVR